MTYRPDIDGLRAIAVVAVIICHINESWLPGGFLGVDMFFVISGFLIGGIIYKDANAGTFSWKQFYLRRIRRILPAFFAVVICCLIVGAYIYAPDSPEWEKAKGTAIWSLPFVDNVYLAISSFYFANSTQFNIFNHLWSLAVEEQFYFVYPIVLIALIKFTPPRFLRTFHNKREIGLCLLLVGAALLSFAMAVISIPLIEAPYYMPHLRFGELIIGAILATLVENPLNISANKVNANLIASVSVVLLLACLILVPFPIAKPWFPGIASSIPCIATAGIIYAGFQHNAVSRFLSLKPIVFIGRISYSLYLWHWPILAFARYLRITEPTNEVKLIVVILTVILSLLSYYFIEQPLRHRQWSFTRTVLLYYIVPSLAVVGITYYNSENTEKFKDAMNWFVGSQNRVRAFALVGDSTKQPDVLLLGNSHTQHLFYFYNTLGKKEGWSGYFSGVGGLYPSDLPHQKSISDAQYKKRIQYPISNGQLNELRSKRLLTDLPQIKTVVISINWWNDSYNDDIISSIKFFQHKGKEVILLISCMKYDNPKVIESYYKSQHPWLLPLCNKEIPIRGEIYNDVTSKVAINRQKITKLFPRIKWVDLTPLIPNSLTVNGHAVLFNSFHFNDFGARCIAERFIQSKQRLIPASDSTTHCKVQR